MSFLEPLKSFLDDLPKSVSSIKDMEEIRQKLQELVDAKGTIELLRSQLESARKEIRFLELAASERNKYEEELKVVQLKLQEMNAANLKLQELCERLKNENETLRIQNETLQSQNETLLKEIKDLNMIIAQLQEKILEQDSRIAEQDSRIRDLEGGVTFMRVRDLVCYYINKAQLALPGHVHAPPDMLLNPAFLRKHAILSPLGKETEMLKYLSRAKTSATFDLAHRYCRVDFNTGQIDFIATKEMIVNDFSQLNLAPNIRAMIDKFIAFMDSKKWFNN
jgi:uncharacterized phage infection (PIP) family protein YhgE